MSCTYSFAGPDGKRVTIAGKNAFKAYLANGGLAHLLPARASALGQRQALDAIRAASDLFRIPVSDKDTVEGIAADTDPGIKVKTVTSIPGETRYNFTLPDGQTARMVVRPFNKYGKSVYGYDLVDGEMRAIDDGRPGKNAEHVEGRDDVWIDVSLLDEGTGYGAKIYHIAANYAHNIGKVFIGDPAGLSNAALQRRPEMMLSSALKFGTTEHLAPHPRQIAGDREQGVPGLDWVYGDDAGNIRKLIDVTMATIENNGGNGNVVYNKKKGIFEDGDGNTLTRADITDLAELGLGRAAQAGGATLARNAVWQSLLREEGGRSDVLGALVQLLRNHDPVHMGSPLRDILYSGGPVRAATQASLTAAGLRQNLTTGALGPVIARLIDHGAIVLHDTIDSLPSHIRRVPGLQAVTTKGQKIHLVGASLTAQNARAVLLHEAFHKGAEHLIGTPQWQKMMGRLDGLYRQSQQSSGGARRFFDAARARVQAAERQGAVARDMSAEEFAAYAIEEYESAPATLKKWVDDLIGLVKAWLQMKFGRQLGEVTPAQLSALAKMAVLDVAADQRGEMFGAAGELFSVDDSRTIEVDGKRRPIRDSAGRLIAGGDFAKQVAFWKWFGDSKMVDENGRPLVLYHSATDDKVKFDKHGKFMGYTGISGISVTDNPEMASRYLDRFGSFDWQGKPFEKNVMALYVKAEKPLFRNEPFKTSLRLGAPLPDGYVSEVEKMGYDALVRDDSISRGGAVKHSEAKNAIRGREIVVFDPTHIKSATGNYGAFDPSNPDIRYSVAASATAAAPADTGLTPPEQGVLRRMQAQLQDNQNRVKQVQERIAKLTGRPLPEAGDYYGAEANRPGRIAARLEEAKEQLTGPLVEKLAKSGRTIAQLGELLHAMHAGERNAKIAEINPDMPDGGSGMTNKEARAVLDKYRNDRELHAIAKEARAIARATLDLKLAYGLIDEQTHATLTDHYEFYVPLKGDGEYGPKIKRAMGHAGRDEFILENIARDYDQAVVVGEKNLARQALLRMVLANPDPELWTVGVPPKGRRIAGQVFQVKLGGKVAAEFDSLAQATAFVEGKGGKGEIVGLGGERVVEFAKPLQDNEVMVYVKGDPVRIQIYDEKLAAQVRPLDQARMGPILEFMRGTNRYLSKIYTGYNPAFIFRNAARDAMTGTINMLGNEGAGTAAKAWAKYPAAVAALGKWAATGNVPDGAMGRYLKEYRAQGGKVGASWMSDLEEQGKTLQFMFDNARGFAATAKEGDLKRTAAVGWHKTVGKMAHVVEVMNQATENGLRLALYASLREQGVSAGKAAQAAKSVTVDFDRKGTATGMLSAIYLFINPAIQGTANAMKTLSKGEHKAQAWAALGALAMLGLWAASKGMDDDRDRWLGESWDTRTRNFMLTIGSHHLRVPLSQEFAPVYAFGVALAEAMRGESAMRSALHVVSSFIDAYFPLQGAYSADSDNHGLDAALAATPTILKPATQIATNRNSFGGQIVPESDATTDRPDNQKMYRGTKNSAYDKAAQGVAAVGQWFGAGKYENDLSKVSPETLKLLWRTYTGGLGAFITDSVGLAGMAATEGMPIETTDVPIAKDFWKANDVKAIRGRYYDLTKEARAAIAEFEQARKMGDGEAIEKMGDAKLDLVALGRMVRSTNKAAAAIRDMAVDINADEKLSAAEKRAQTKALEADEEALYRSAIAAFK